MGDIRFYNTLTHEMDRFDPIAPPTVTMYNCGPTVYDFAHIGNFRAFVFADVLRRFLEFRGYDVRQVMNLTDVGHMTEDRIADGGGEDKMQLAARRLRDAKKSGQPLPGAVENPDDPYQIAEYYTQAFLTDARNLRLKIADEYPDQMPRATAHIEDMQAMIARLIDAGHAYVADGGAVGGAVYYNVQSFPDYGQLSGNTLDKLRGGAGGRVTPDTQAGKRHPADFLLWKADPSHVMRWDSPWGEGYPGWHIECSSMATRVLGQETIDIHTGGEDNIFPHHECEIAQTRGATGRDHFANYWLHTRFLLVEGQKMSKSLGNFYTVRDVLEGKVTGRPVDPAVLRFELFKAHYRSNMNFTAKGLEDSGSAVRKLRDAAQRYAARVGRAAEVGGGAEVGADHPTLRAFSDALADDLNMAGALAAVFEYIAQEHEGAEAAEALAVLGQVDRVLGVIDGVETGGREEAEESGQPESVADRCHELDAARARKDFDTADALRAELIAAGYSVKTTKHGTVATKPLA